MTHFIKINHFQKLLWGKRATPIVKFCLKIRKLKIFFIIYFNIFSKKAYSILDNVKPSISLLAPSFWENIIEWICETPYSLLLWFSWKLNCMYWVLCTHICCERKFPAGNCLVQRMKPFCNFGGLFIFAVNCLLWVCFLLAKLFILWNTIFSLSIFSVPKCTNDNLAPFRSVVALP